MERTTQSLVGLTGLLALVLFCLGGIVPAAGLEAPHVIATFDQMPKIVALPDGSLFAFLHKLSGDMDEATASTSTDNGRTWSVPKKLFDLPQNEGGFGYTLPFCDRSGELHLFLFCDANSGVVRPPRGPKPTGLGPYGKLDIWQARTTGNRSAWLLPRRIWEGRAGDMQSVIQLTSGRILLPISYYVPGDWSHRGSGPDAFTWMGQFRTSALYSDDGGASWKQSPSVLKVPCPGIGGLGAIEPVVIQLKDGHIWMLIRTEWGRFYESDSKDGVEWTPARPSPLTSSDSPAGLLRLKDGRILLLVNDCHRFPYAQGGRQVLQGAISSDEGQTWHGFREVLRDPYRDAPPPPNGDHGVSYPYPVLLSDGRVLVTLWSYTGKDRTVVAFDPNWLLETRQEEDFAHGLDAWSVFGTRGAELVSHPDKPDQKALSLRRVDSEWPCGAVWNFPSASQGSLRLRLLVQPGFAGHIGLTDSFSVPFDDQDALYNLYNLTIEPGGRIGNKSLLSPGRWHTVELAWDCGRQTCRLLIDGQQAAILPQQRVSAGATYLRLVAQGQAAPDTGMFLEQITFRSEGR